MLFGIILVATFYASKRLQEHCMSAELFTLFVPVRENPIFDDSRENRAQQIESADLHFLSHCLFRGIQTHLLIFGTYLAHP